MAWIFEGQHVVVAVSAGDAERRAADEHARAGDVAGVDRVAQGHVGEAVGADVADGGESGEQSEAGVFRADQGLARDGNGQRIVAKARFHGQVRVRVDQAGQDGGVRQFDLHGVGGNFRVGGCT